MKLISNDLRDGDKLPHRHVFNGTGDIGHRTTKRLPALFHFVCQLFRKV